MNTERVHHQPLWKLQYSPIARRTQRYEPPASGIMEPISDATNAIGTLHTNGSTTIISKVSPGPEDETTSSMPNEPEQVSVNTTMTAVKRRIRTRFRPWLRNISVIRSPDPRRAPCDSVRRVAGRCVPQSLQRTPHGLLEPKGHNLRKATPPTGYFGRKRGWRQLSSSGASFQRSTPSLSFSA